MGGVARRRLRKLPRSPVARMWHEIVPEFSGFRPSLYRAARRLLRQAPACPSICRCRARGSQSRTEGVAQRAKLLDGEGHGHNLSCAARHQRRRTSLRACGAVPVSPRTGTYLSVGDGDAVLMHPDRPRRTRSNRPSVQGKAEHHPGDEESYHDDPGDDPFHPKHPSSRSGISD